MTSDWRSTASPDEAKAAKAFALVAAVEPAPVDLARWRLVEEGLIQRRQQRRLIVAFVGAVTLGIVGTVALSPRAPTQAPFQATANTVWATTADGAVRLDKGLLAHRPTRSTPPVTVVTPDVSIQTNHAQFLADVSDNGTDVSVDEGEVSVRAKDGVVRVLREREAGRWLRVMAAVPSLTPVEPTDAPCADLSDSAKVACLERETAGSGLAAQAALFELALVKSKRGDSSEAAAVWAQSLARFPEGVLHPEVRLALMLELLKSGRTTEAEAVAAQFLVRCATDSRSADVKALRARMRRDR